MSGLVLVSWFAEACLMGSTLAVLQFGLCNCSSTLHHHFLKPCLDTRICLHLPSNLRLSNPASEISGSMAGCMSLYASPKHFTASFSYRRDSLVGYILRIVSRGCTLLGDSWLCGLDCINLNVQAVYLVVRAAICYCDPCLTLGAAHWICP